MFINVTYAHLIMKPETMYRIGLGCVIGGVIILVLNALDYLAEWLLLPRWLSAVGIILVTIGLVLANKSSRMSRS